jgi:hypothetical protein
LIVTRQQNNSRGDPQNPSVTDPEDFNAQRRLRQIHDARERFPEVRREARERYNPSNPRNSDLDKEAYFERVAQALVDYLVEIEPIAKRGATDPDDEHHQKWDDDPVVTDADENDLTLLDILNQDGEMLRDDVEDADEPVMGPLTETASRKAYRQANQMINDIGLGVGLEKGGLQFIEGFDPSTGEKGDLRNAKLNGEPPL